MTLRTHLFCLTILALYGDAYKILLYSTPMGYSHVQFAESIASILYKAGHDVTVVHPVLEKRFKDYWERSPVKKVYFPAPKELVQRHESRGENIWITPVFGGNIRTVLFFMEMQKDLCDVVLNDTTKIDELKNENFDIGIYELFGSCGLGIAEVVGAKSFIMLSTIGIVDALAPIFHTPLNPSYVPASMTLYTDRMNFLQRFLNFGYVAVSELIFMKFTNRKYEAVFRKHGFELEFVDLIKKKTNFLLSNSDEFLDLARPLSRKIKHIGGIALGNIGNLTKDFDEILSLKPKTVLISFGSVAPTSSMPVHIKDGILETIKSLPQYTFIWKIDKNELGLGKDISNLKTFSWIPQRELLSDTRVSLFVSHAGLNSLLETVRTGTPAVLIPIFGDQFKNAAIMSRKNTSHIIEKDKFTKDIFKLSVTTLLNEKSYLHRAERLADLMRTRKETPADRLLEAVEFTGRFRKIEDLDIYGFELGFIQYFCLDVIAAYMALLLIFIYLIMKAVKVAFGRNKVKSE